MFDAGYDIQARHINGERWYKATPATFRVKGPREFRINPKVTEEELPF